MTPQPIKVDVLIVRALKTFLQAFLAVVLAGLTTAIDLATTKALLIGALAAGVSAVMNLFLVPQEAR
jgi:hypothetical protein